MNILIATGIYPPEMGGPATYSYELVHALRARGHKVAVVAYGNKKSSDEGVTFVSRAGGGAIRYLRYAWAVYRAARHMDVIFVQGAVSEGVPATLVATLIGKKVVMRIPGDYAWEMGMQASSLRVESSLDAFLARSHRGIIGLYERIERWTTRRAQRVIVPSDYLRTVVERWEIPSERITVCKNAVKALPDTEGRAEVRKRLGFKDQVVCLTAVRAVPWKGVAELIRWWHRLPSQHVLVVAGDGPELKAWQRLATQEGVQDRIHFLGRIDRKILTEWYDAADCFLLHTGYEGYPHTVPEAISRGVPCFVSDQGGNPETCLEFGDRVTVLPYQDRDAWVAALSCVIVRTGSVSPKSLWTHAMMVNQVELILAESIHPTRQTPAQIVMVGYERGLLKTESAVFERIASLAQEPLRIFALVLARLPADVAIERDRVYVQGFGGSALRRVWHTIRAGFMAARRLPGRTLVSGQDPFAAGFVAYLLSRLTNQPLELQEHGDFWSGAWEKERFVNRIWSYIGLILLNRAESVRVVSERVKLHLIARGIESHKIGVIPVAQDLEAFLARPLPTHYENEIVLRAPARLVEQKGFDVLIEAFAIVHGRHLNTRLEVIGTGPCEDALRALVEHHHLTQAVDIRPWIDYSELWEGADILVISSRYEGFGRTMVEAMAAGVSVVTTDVGCAGTHLRSEVDGLIVPIDDAVALASGMNRLIEDGVFAHRLRVSAREQAKTFPDRQTLHELQRAAWSDALLAGQQKTIGPRFELWVIGFFSFAILTRALSVVLFHAQLLTREWGFFTLVQHWFQGYGYSFASQAGCVSAYRSPGYLFFLTALYSVFNPMNTWAQAIIQNIFVVGALWLTYVVGKRLVGPRGGLVAGFIMACYPYTFYHYTQFYHTFLQSFFLLLVVWLVLRLVDTKRLAYAIMAGLGIGALAYVQGTILPITPLIALWVFWQFWPEWKRACLSIAIMGVCAAGLIAPWTYRNWTVFHHFVPLTTDVGHALFKANNENIYEVTKRGYPQEIIEDIASSTNPFYKQYRLPDYLETDLQQAGVLHESILWTEWHPKEPNRMITCDQRGPLDEYQFNQYWTQKTESFWRDHSGLDVWKLPLQKIVTFWGPGLFPTVKTGAPWSFAGTAWKEWLARASVGVSTAVVIIFGWIGLVIQLKRRQRTVFLILSFLIIFTLLHSLIAGYTKYRIPLDHLLAAYAGFTLVLIWDWIRYKRV